MSFPKIGGVTPSPELLFGWLSKRVTDALLERIAWLDYGYDAKQHFAALKTIRDTGAIARPLGWVPLEVLRLARGLTPGKTPGHSGPPITAIDAQLINAFACAVQLLDRARGDTASSNTAGNDELCRMLTALDALGSEALAAGLPFAAWLGEHWPRGGDSVAFVAVALVWLALRSRAEIAGEELSRLIAFALDEEAREAALWGKGIGPHPERWLIGTAVYGHKARWQKIGADLRIEAEALPSGSARDDVLHLADLLVEGDAWR